MIKITYQDQDGSSREVEAEEGSTVMETAISNDVPGIEAECGGACACATCHVYVDEEWREKRRRALADGRGHARLRLRRAAELAAVVPDQGDRRSSTGSWCGRPSGRADGRARDDFSSKSIIPLYPFVRA